MKSRHIHTLGIEETRAIAPTLARLGVAVPEGAVFQVHVVLSEPRPAPVWRPGCGVTKREFYHGAGCG